MNNKITLSQLAERLASELGTDAAGAENLVREYFSLVADTLAEGESVKVKGLGTFRLSGIEARESVDVNTGKRVVIPGHVRAGFTPEKSVAEAVNAPFAAFEAVELSENISESELEETVGKDITVSDSFDVTDDAVTDSDAEAVMDPVVENHVTEEPEMQNASPDNSEDEKADTEEVMPEPELSEEVHAESSVAVETPEPEKENPEVSGTADNVEDSLIYPDEDRDRYRDRRPRRGNFLTGFFIGLACMFAVLGGIWCWYRFAPESFDSILGRPQPVNDKLASTTPAVVSGGTEASSAPSVSSAGVAADESVELVVAADTLRNDGEDIVPTPPSDAETADKKVYDTITRTRYLTTMARDHYGSYHLWPYIYKENSAILGHPDRIRPGTRVVIPPAEKYGIDAKDKECIAKAKKMGVEIYARYK